MDLQLSSESAQCDAFSRAFARQNQHFETALQSLDSLNDQIAVFFACEHPSAAEEPWLAAAVTRRLLAEAQAHFHKMLSDNRALASRIDGDIATAQRQVAALRAELRAMAAVTSEQSSKADDSSLDANQNSAPECDLLGKVDSEDSLLGGVALPKDHLPKPRRPKTKSDPLDEKHRSPHHPRQEFSVLSSPSCVMRHKAGVVAKVPAAGWDAQSWRKSSTTSSSDSQEEQQPPSASAARPPIRDEGRFVVFDSKDVRRREWRISLSESYREQQQKEDVERQEPPEEKDDSGGGKAAVPESSYFKKTSSDYPAFKSGVKDDSVVGGEVEAMRIKNSALLRDLEEVMESRDEKAKENAAMSAKIDHLDKELKHAKEALSALKQDRKRLKAEKFDLLTQMKQLYSTLEDKEAELREFIRNYEQRIKESEENMKQMVKDREEMEQEKWNILKRARDEAERAVLLCTQLGLKDAHIKELQEEISMLKAQQHSGGLMQHSNGFGSPGAISFRNGTPTPTPGSDPTTSPSYAGTPTMSSVHYMDPMSPHKGVMVQSLSPDHRPALLSRSAEDIFNNVALGEMASVKKKTKEKKGTWGSISRVFSRSKKRKPLDPELFENHRSSWSPKESPPLMSEESYVQKLRLLDETHGAPMQHWRAATVLAWLEITMDMPQYGAACAENIKSGKLLLELSDSELEEGLGISNVMHRRKLRLAIEEHRQPSLCRYPKICQLTHAWVLEEWLPSIALPCYLPIFSEHLVDGRVLDTLTKKDLEKHFGITRKFHQLSIMHAIQLLRMLNFDRQLLHQRRVKSESMDIDPLVWTNERLVKWSRSIELVEYADRLRGSGVHGALAVLEPSFTADTIATALGVPTSKNILRRHLTTEWQNLIQPARLSLESESVVSSRKSSEKRLASGSSSISLVSQGRSSSCSMPSYARRTLDRYDRRRSSWRESLRSLTSSKKSTPVSTTVERPHVLPLSPKLNTPRHRRTFSSHSDVETLTVTPV